MPRQDIDNYDEDPAAIDAAFERGEKGRTAPHLPVGAAFVHGVPTFGSPTAIQYRSMAISLQAALVSH